MNQKVKTILYHLFYWSIYLIYFQFILFVTLSDYSFHISEFLIISLSQACIFYSTSFIIVPIVVVSKRYFWGIMLFLSLFILYLFINYEVYYAYFLDGKPKKITLDSDLIILLFKKNRYHFLNLFMYGIAYWQFINHKLKVEQNQNENDSNFNSKVDYLKTQLNQFFLKEMLDYYKTKSQKFSLNLANSFGQLSSLIGFSTSKENDFCLLNDEIKNVYNFIALNQERYDDKLKIQISITGEMSDFYVPHLILLTLVENAFKHGNLKINPFIFELNVSNDKLFLNLENEINHVNLTNSTKLGISNIKQRLEVLFGNNYKYIEKVEDNKYKTMIELINSNNEAPKRNN